MPRLSKSLPKYRRHRKSGQAVVTLSGRDIYLGPHGTKTSRLEYDRLISEWLANGRSLATSTDADGEDELTVVELIAGYLRHLKEAYPNHAQPGSEPYRVVPVLRTVKALHGRTLAREFGPLALKAVRQKFIDAGQCRSFVNDNARRVVRMFRWGVANELLHPDTLRSLQSVEGLRKGRSEAPEGRKVRPVPLADVDATLPHLPLIVGDMVRLHLILGCRPSELLGMKPGHIERADSRLWTYNPPQHKNSHRDMVRSIYLGPKAIAILSPYMLRSDDEYCFSPRESEGKRRDILHAQRKTPMSSGNRPGSKKPKTSRTVGDCYTCDSYRRAIERGAKKAGVHYWYPRQLRHTRGTQLSEQFGIEGAACILGHANLQTTQIYAEKSESKAREIARQVG